ncbi:MAG: PP2C family protein-serine/threonine phosphatase, partial [Rudaea sp.]
SITRIECDPHAVLSELNRQLYPDVKEDGSFITAFLARLDPRNHVLEYANAGNWPAYVLDAQGRIRHELRADGIAVGIFPELTLRRNEPIRLVPGSLVVLLTDGIPEAGNEANGEYGVRRMLAAIRRHRQAPSYEIVRLVRESIQSFTGHAEQADDQTLIVLKRAG